MSRLVWKYQPGPPVQSWELEVQHCFVSVCPKVQLHGAHLLGSDLDFESCTTFFEMLGRGPCPQRSASSGSGQTRVQKPPQGELVLKAVNPKEDKDFQITGLRALGQRVQTPDWRAFRNLSLWRSLGDAFGESMAASATSHVFSVQTLADL